MSKRAKPAPTPLPGFAEGAGQPPLAPLPEVEKPAKVALEPYVPHTPPPRVRTKIGPGGRVVIPAAFRAAAGMEEGAEGMLTLHGQEVRVITPKASLQRVQEWAMQLAKPGVSVVDELIAERRAEAEAEND